MDNNNREIMSKDLTHVAIYFDKEKSDKVFLQRVEPTTASETPLSESEQIILKLFRDNSLLQKELNTCENDFTRVNNQKDSLIKVSLENTELKKQLEQSKRENERLKGIKKVYVIQEKERLLIHGCFSSLDDAKRYIDNSEKHFIMELEVK